MIIQCDRCSARFRLDDSKVAESGVKIRCKRCQHIFLVSREPDRIAADRDLLAERQPEAAQHQEIPPLEPLPVPEPPPQEPAPVPEPPPDEPAWPEDDSAPFSLQVEEPERAPAEVPPIAEQDTDDDVPADAPLLAEPEPPAAPSPSDDFRFSFEPEPDESGNPPVEYETPPASPTLPPEKSATPPASPERSPEPAGTWDFAAAPPPVEAPAYGAPAGTTVAPPAAPDAPAPPAGGVTGEPSRPAATAPPASRRQGPSFLTVLGMLLGGFMLLLVAGGGALYLLEGPEALQKIGIIRETGERILLKNVEGSYVTGNQAGELFVIRGEAFTSQQTPEPAIRVRGVIYNAAGAVILERSAFCGNPLSPEQLATLPLEKIEAVMKNRSGASAAAGGVPPGKGAPFVIVFPALPKEAVDFGVEVAGASAATR